MEKKPNLQKVIKAAGIFLNPTDNRIRNMDQHLPGPFIGVVYYLPNFSIFVHTSYAPPSNN